MGLILSLCLLLSCFQTTTAFQIEEEFASAEIGRGYDVLFEADDGFHSSVCRVVVVAVTVDGVVYGIDFETGEQRWQLSTASPLITSRAENDSSLVLVPGLDGTVYVSLGEEGLKVNFVCEMLFFPSR